MANNNNQGYVVYTAPRQAYGKIAAQDLPGQTAGFVTPQMRPRSQTSTWLKLWNEFWGSFWITLVGKLMVAAVGGSVIASTGIGLIMNAFANAFVLFVVMVVYGTASGGHFDPAITFSIWLIEMATYYIFGNRRFGIFRGKLVKNKEGKLVEPDSITTGFTARKLHWYSVWIPLLYPFFQLLGFFLAALILLAILPGGSRKSPIELGMPFKGPFVGDNGKIWGAQFIASTMFIGVFVLLMKYFGGQGHVTQAIKALVMGFAQFVLILAFGGYAGGDWNAGRWLALASVSGRFNHWWIFATPSFLAAIVVALYCWIHWWIGHIPRITRNMTDTGKKWQLTFAEMQQNKLNNNPNVYNYVQQY